MKDNKDEIIREEVETGEKEVVKECFSYLPIGFIGNSKNGSSPFGAVCDLRVYSEIIKMSQIYSISNYHKDLEFEMADKYACMFVENGLLNRLIGDLFSYSRPNILCNLLKVLRHLATH